LDIDERARSFSNDPSRSIRTRTFRKDLETRKTGRVRQMNDQ